jgi:hypothetical protein
VGKEMQICGQIAGWGGGGAVFRSRIRLDPKLFGFKDQDPKLLILDLDAFLFHTKLRNMFLKRNKK